MSSTLTEARNVACRIQGVGPDSARCLAIFKTVPGGKELKALLEPGQRFKVPFWSSAEGYFGYAISVHTNLHHDFSRRYDHKDPNRIFILQVELDFRVGDPKRLALSLARDDDPVQLLEAEAARLLGLSARALDWQTVLAEADGFGTMILNAETGTTQGERIRIADRLVEIAKSLGLDLQRVGVARSLPGTDVAVIGVVLDDEAAVTSRKGQLAHEEEKSAELRRREVEEMKLESERLANQQRAGLQAFQRLQGFLDEFARQAGRALTHATDDVRSFPAIRDALREITEIQNSFAAISTGQASVTDAATLRLAAVSTPGALAAGGTMSDPLERTVTRFFGALQGFAGAPADHRRLLVLGLHLIAEVAMGDEADEEYVEGCQSALKEHFGVLVMAMPPDQIKAVRSLLSRESLRRDLGIGEARHV